MSELPQDPAQPEFTSNCPNCGRDAYWTDEEKVEIGRQYFLMKCSHCFNRYWLFCSGARPV